MFSQCWATVLKYLHSIYKPTEMKAIFLCNVNPGLILISTFNNVYASLTASAPMHITNIGIRQQSPCHCIPTDKHYSIIGLSIVPAFAFIKHNLA